MLSECDLQRKSVQYRQALLRLIKAAKAGHTGGDLSCLDILNVLYNRILRVSPETFKGPDHDHFIQSKGHCAEALFVVLAKTRKGKGVSFMENVAKWHHGVPNEEEFNRAMAELEAAQAALA
jgi:transketolase N-terminal domain/subunit